MPFRSLAPSSRTLMGVAAVFVTALVTTVAPGTARADGTEDSLDFAHRKLDFDRAGRDAEFRQIIKDKFNGTIDLEKLDMTNPIHVLVKADLETFTEKFAESNETLKNLKKLQDPPIAEYYWRTARNYFLLGEYLPMAAKDQRLKFYKRETTVAEKCVEKYPNEAQCIFFASVGRGRQGTTMGLMNAFFKGILKPKRMLEDMVRVIELRPTERSPTGQYNALANAYATLSIFYRQAPRGFFPRVFIGVEGDRQKSVEWINKAVEAEPNNVMYAKEQGIALMCLAHQEEDAINQELRQKAIAAFKRTIGLRARNWLDRVDQEHSRLFVENPKIEKMSCKYNRDGFEETESKDFEADKKRAEEEAKAKAAAPAAAASATTTTGDAADSTGE
jgi:tetratricopeptide (TPR) repeat protein